MIQVTIFILGVLLGVGLTWVVERSHKNEGALGRVFSKINKKKREQVKIQKDRILEFMKEHGRITNDEAQDQLGVSDSTATRRFNDLKAEGSIIEKGIGKNIYYELKP